MKGILKRILKKKHFEEKLESKNERKNFKFLQRKKTSNQLMGYIRMFVEYDEKVRQDRRKQRESTSKKV